ncbi:S24 family peptidase [Bacteroides pyogenes]|uniref:S24 family peptidase n=1 Tax=Bacteroides pyogenes TaxID=310300 RepID=UPI001F3CB922|nr:hypothetical protein [Bacteroides pyogenes]MCE9107662.1 hypothetical protein [Bacteroides pyogenes]
MTKKKDEKTPIKVAFQYLKSKGLVHTQQDVADKMSVSKENLSRALNRKDGYHTKSFLSRFNATFGGIFDEEWLWSGIGKMLIEGNASLETNASPILEAEEREYYTENKNGDVFYDLGDGRFLMKAPLVPYEAYGQFANEEITLQSERDEWSSEIFEVDELVQGNFLAFKLRGDSMDDGTRDSFEEGEVVLARELDKSHWKDGLKYKKHPYWVVVFDSSVLIKQVVNQDLKRGMVTFHSISDSPEYRDFELNLDEIRKLYYVVQKKPKTVRF